MSSNLRVGQGYDVHQTVKGRPLLIGGVQIPSDFGLEGHSDADVLLHAITDALFGAAGLGDIGLHFPDTDAKWKGADSRLLLSEACELVKKKGFKPVNVDTTIIAQQPKLAPYMQDIRKSVANILRLPIDCINVKAKTNEHLGYLGRGEGIEAQAVILIEKIPITDEVSVPPFLLGDLPV